MLSADWLKFLPLGVNKASKDRRIRFDYLNVASLSEAAIAVRTAGQQSIDRRPKTDRSDTTPRRCALPIRANRVPPAPQSALTALRRNLKMFNEKLDLKLIGLVRDNTVLYDHNNPQYMDFNAREVVWQKIGDELKRPGKFYVVYDLTSWIRLQFTIALVYLRVSFCFCCSGRVQGEVDQHKGH